MKERERERDRKREREREEKEREREREREREIERERSTYPKAILKLTIISNKVIVRSLPRNSSRVLLIT